MNPLLTAVTNLNKVLDAGDPSPIVLAECQPVLVETVAKLTRLTRAKKTKHVADLLVLAETWKEQFAARTHDVREFGLFLDRLVNTEGMSLREAGELVGIPNASGVASRIRAVKG